MNNIPVKQNSKAALDLLAAQRELYSLAKRVRAARFTAILLIPLFLMPMVGIYEWLREYVALFGVVVLILDLVLAKPKIKRLTRTAAMIQEEFDCDVLGLEWNEIKAGSKVGPETISRYANKYRKHKDLFPSLGNWYAPAVGKLSERQGRLVCQRSNCVWDASLRRRYLFLLKVTISLVSVIAVTLSLVRDISLSAFVLTVVVPLAPVYLLLIRELREISESIDRVVHLGETVTAIWLALISERRQGVDFDASCRSLQDEILLHRSSGPLLFDWIFNLSWREHESEMVRGVESLVGEVVSG